MLFSTEYTRVAMDFDKLPKYPNTDRPLKEDERNLLQYYIGNLKEHAKKIYEEHGWPGVAAAFAGYTIPWFTIPLVPGASEVGAFLGVFIYAQVKKLVKKAHHEMKKRGQKPISKSLALGPLVPLLSVGEVPLEDLQRDTGIHPMRK